MKRAAAVPKPQLQSGWVRYFEESESAFAALIFVLPWIVLYEVGTRYATFDPASHTEQRIVAFTMLQNSLAALGATARWVAPAAVVSVLLSLAIFRHERLRVRITTQAGMIVESLLLAIPLLLLSIALSKIKLLSGPEPVSAGAVLSIGAGIYEEFIFRLLGLVALHFFLVDFLGISATIGTLIAILGCGILFSLYHYWGPESFTMQTFVFRALAGTYFGGVMLSRGFGVTVGCHMVYDLAVCWIHESSAHHG